MYRILFVAAGALLIGGAAAAQEPAPLVTDRPDFTESTETVPAGRVQFEGGYTPLRSGGVDEHAIGEVLLRLGVSGRTELRLGLNSFLVARVPGEPTSTGLEGASLGANMLYTNT